jgi:hypothetical protein
MSAQRVPALCVYAIGLAACGSRTELLVPAGAADDAGRLDASADASPDVIAPFDASVGPDSALSCPDGGLPTAYLFDVAGALYTFSPATLETVLLGTPDCGTTELPWTVSVSREGVAYLVYEDWNIYAVDLATLACHPTVFQSGQLGIDAEFAIAVSRATPTERMFVYGQPAGMPGPILTSTDLTSFVLTEVGPVLPLTTPEAAFDMQADLSGHLFVFTADGVLTEIDATTAQITSTAPTGFPPSTEDSWAVMTYEDQVYMFANLEVARYDATSHTAVVLGSLTGTGDIVGASAVPCVGPQ